MNDYLLKGKKLDYLLSVKDKEANMYTFFYNMCTSILERQGELCDFERDFISAFWNVDGDSRFREFDYIPRDEFMLLMAEELLQFLKLYPESPRIKALKNYSMGRFKDWLPEDKRNMLDSIGRLEFSDAAMLINLQDHLKQHSNIYPISPTVDAVGNESKSPKENNDIPSATKAREGKIREVFKLNIPEWQKAEKVGETVRQWQRDKKYLGLTNPRKKRDKKAT
jgi:hypothetical protein